jgi:hypothetical protein
MKRMLLLALALAMIGGVAGGAVAWAKAGDNGESPLDGRIMSYVGGTFEIILDANPTTGYSWITSTMPT